MDVANQEGGLVIGTGDLSELALGWCTYNGDHMSHLRRQQRRSEVARQAPGILVRRDKRLTSKSPRRSAMSSLRRSARSCCPPTTRAQIAQKTEDVVGPYELHDFFLFHFLRNGFAPRKDPEARPPSHLPGNTTPASSGNGSGAFTEDFILSSSNGPACRTASRLAPSACRRAATGVCPATLPPMRC